jgi:hypothetical protein
LTVRVNWVVRVIPFEVAVMVMGYVPAGVPPPVPPPVSVSEEVPLAPAQLVMVARVRTEVRSRKRMEDQ